MTPKLSQNDTKMTPEFHANDTKHCVKTTTEATTKNYKNIKKFQTNIHQPITALGRGYGYGMDMVWVIKKSYVVLSCFHTLSSLDRSAIQPRRKERSSAQ